jgi:predicted amino acid dehydrogenase
MNNKFGFIVHPIDRRTFYACIEPLNLLKFFCSENIIDNLAIKMPPRYLGAYKNIRSAREIIVGGDIVAMPILPSQMLNIGEERTVSLIEKCVKYCEKKGDKIVGLGGFASVIGNEGEVVSKRVSIPVTSGNTLTASLILDGIYKAAYLMGLNLSDSIVSIIGATGDIGSICAKILSKKVRKLNIAARNEKKLQDFANILVKYGNAKIEVFKYIKDAIQKADIILTAASSISAIIDPLLLKPGAILCDVAMPANIAKEIAISRDDILVFEGGLAKIPYPKDISNTKMSSAMNINGVYGCLAETITLTFECRFEPFSIGRGNITEEKLAEIKKMATNNGISVSDFFCGYKMFSERDIDNIRKNAERNKQRAYVAQR